MALRSKRSFATYGPTGAPRVVKAGQIVADDDPVVKGRENAFESVDAHLARRRRTEQATADPGEPRTLTPPTGDAFDPGAHKADEVLAYLREADEDERTRVLAAEAAGKNRKGILDKAAE